MNKKISAFIVLTILLLSLSSCNTKISSNTSDKSKTTTTSSTTTISTAPTTELPETTIKPTTTTQTTTKRQTTIKATTTVQTSSQRQTTIPNTTSDLTNTTIKHSPQSWMDFSTLSEYKNMLLTMKSKDIMQKAFEESSQYSSYYLHEDDFEMLLSDKYFLVPILPKGVTLKEATFGGWGSSEFDVQFSDGGYVSFSYRHNLDKYDDSYNYEKTTIKNSRGIKIVREHKAIDGAYNVYYTWKEGDYYCRMTPKRSSKFDVYDDFVKELSFEKISLE